MLAHILGNLDFIFHVLSLLLVIIMERYVRVIFYEPKCIFKKKKKKKHKSRIVSFINFVIFRPVLGIG